MAVSSLTAIEFSQLGIRHARIFYQYNDDKTLRESCYRKDYGWFVRGDGVITHDAKKNSPITATCWLDATGLTHIGVFYLDERNIIRWYQGYHDLASDWKLQPINEVEALNVGQSSQLATVQSSDGEFLHLYYQGIPNAGIKAPIQVIKYEHAQQKWQSRPERVVQDAILGTRMSAIWDRAQKLVRLYYQDHHMLLREVCWAAGSEKWIYPTTTVMDRLVPDAPIAAVGWATLTKGFTNSTPEIRVFTVFAGSEGLISQVSCSNRAWKIGPMRDIPFKECSDIAACRSTGIGTLQRSPICVFYHWQRQGIEMVHVPIDSSTTNSLIFSDIHHPRGIPISVGRQTRDLQRSPDANKQDDQNNIHHGDREQGEHERKAEDLLSQYLNMPANNAEGNSPLHLAVTAGNETAVRLLIQCGAHIDITNARNYTPLHLAVKDGKYALVRLLLEKGADNESCSDDGTVLGMAVLNRKEEIVKLLLDLKADIDGVDKEGNTPVHVGAKLGDVAMSNLLLANSAYVNSQNNVGDTPTHLAASEGHEKIVTLLIARKADIGRANNDGNLPLHKSAYCGKESVVRVLLDNGAKVDSKNNAGNTPLHMATEADKGDMVRFLLENGADVNAQNTDGNTALHLAAAKGYGGLIRLLCEKSASINIMNNESTLPIHLAAGQSHDNLGIDTLLERGANINSKGRDDRTPLHVAIMNENKYTFQYLLEKEAEINSPDSLRKTPLHYAIVYGQKSMIRTLLDKGADFNRPDYRNETPLFCAIEANDEATAFTLLEKGANVNVVIEGDSGPDIYGRTYHQLGTPLHKAVMRRNKALVSLLIDKGACINSSAYLFDQMPLHLAVSNSDVDITMLLVNKGAFVNARYNIGNSHRTPLDLAQDSGCSQEIRQFLISKGATL